MSHDILNLEYWFLCKPYNVHIVLGVFSALHLIFTVQKIIEFTAIDFIK